MSRKHEKLIVAVETNVKATKKLLNASKTIDAIIRQGHYEAQPVSVVSPDQVSFPANFTTTWAEQFARSGVEAVAKTVKKLRVGFKSPPKILPQAFQSRKLSARTITEFASNEGAEMLVLITHLKERTGFLPFGGFAEATMNLSSVPVLAISAKSKPLKKISTLMLTTDFSDECKNGFLATLKIAKSLGCKIRLYHVLARPVPIYTAVGSPMVLSSFEIAAYLDEEEERLRRMAKAWIKFAAGQGVEMEAVFDKGIGSVSSRILRASRGGGKNGADVIALAPQMGRIGAFFFGSTSREILRKSQVPVLLIHGQENRKDTKDAKNQKNQSRKFDDNEAHYDRLLRAP